MPRIVHFEITAENPERAARFYSEIFGWKIEKYNGPKEYWLITTGPQGEMGINGGMYKRIPGFSNYVNIIDVPSVNDFAKKIIKHGGKQIVPKITIRGIGYSAYFQDTEGNAFGVIEEDKSAK